MKLHLALVLIILHVLNLHSANIVFDLGNVLINHNTKTVAFSIGIKNLIQYATEDKKNPFSLSTFVLEILRAFGDQKVTSDTPAATLRGHTIPQIVCDFFAGSISSQEIISKALHRIQELDAQQFFCSSRQKELAEQAVKVLFDPKEIVQYMELSLPGFKILKKCLAERNPDGSPAHSIYILSNWDAESFALLKKTPLTKKLFNLIDEKKIIISAHIGTIKPYKKAYQTFLALTGLQAKDCIFIDDQIENITMAKQEGFTCIHVPDKNFAKVERRLKNLGVLS